MQGILRAPITRLLTSRFHSGIHWILRTGGPVYAALSGENPSRALYLRYLRGEITRDQYTELVREAAESTPEKILTTISRFL